MSGSAQWYPEADRAATVAGARALFAEHVGGQPLGVWSAPGRVNLIGEHVDYADGLVLPFALPHRTAVALRLRDDGQVRLWSAQSGGNGSGGNGSGAAGSGALEAWSGRAAELGPGSVQGWAAYAAGVAWALTAQGLLAPADLPGFDAVVDGRVPLGSGLSSSAALEAAVAVALDDALGLGLGATDEGRTRLAEACVRAENEVAGAATGGMDQAAALRSQDRHAMLLDCRDASVTHLPLDLAADGRVLLVIDTRVHHSNSDGQYAARRRELEAALAGLGVASLREVADSGRDPAELPGWADLGDVPQRRARHVLTEIGRVREAATLLAAGRIADAGPLLTASHASLRDDYEVSCPELDAAVAAALEAGAAGARMTGGGFGGSAIAVVREADVEAVASAVDDAVTRVGRRRPRLLVAVPSEPAARDS
ncbi:MAG: galactokinase [Kineosporiaceae bacterium]